MRSLTSLPTRFFALTKHIKLKVVPPFLRVLPLHSAYTSYHYIMSDTSVQYSCTPERVHTHISGVSADPSSLLPPSLRSAPEPTETLADIKALFAAYPLPAPNPNSRRLEDRLGIPGVNMGRPLLPEPPVPSALQLSEARVKAANERAEAAEEGVRQANTRAKAAEEAVRVANLRLCEEIDATRAWRRAESTILANARVDARDDFRINPADAWLMSEIKRVDRWKASEAAEEAARVAKRSSAEFDAYHGLRRAKAAEEAVREANLRAEAAEEAVHQAAKKFDSSTSFYEKNEDEMQEELDEAWEHVKAGLRRESINESTLQQLKAGLEKADAARISAVVRAEEAEESVRQLKEEVAQVYLADMIARDATERAEITDRNFLRLQRAISTVLYSADHVYYDKIYNEYDNGD